MTSRRILISIFIGLLFSSALAPRFYDVNSLAPVDRLLLLLVPALAIAFCAFYALPLLEDQSKQISQKTKLFLLILSFVSAFTIAYPFSNGNILLSIGKSLSLTILFLAATLPAAPALQTAAIEKTHIRLLFGWIISTTLIFLLSGILDNYYNGIFEFICLLICLHFVIGAFGYFLAGRAMRSTQASTADVIITMALSLLLLTLTASVTFFGSQHPQLFNIKTFALLNEFIPIFFTFSLLALPWQAWGINKARQYLPLKETRLYSFLDQNAAGLLLALSFFALYLVTASMLNHPRFDVDDVFFDADVFNWRVRLTTDNFADYYWRSVHPFILLLFKPPIDLIAFFLKGDRLFAAYIFTALGGAACVFLAWRFTRNISSDTVYPLLIASLLGLSASHLIFGSLIESYIFLALCLLLFYVLLIENRPFPALVAAGLATIGITHSNFAQNVIALFTVKPNIKLIVRYIATVLVILVLLTLLNNLLYPDSQPFFFIPSTLQAEQQNLFPLNSLRIQALTRAFLFHNVVAPTPTLHTGEIPFTQFRFFKPEVNSLSRYETPLQDFTAWLWIGLLALAAVTYLINFKKHPHKPISLALGLCVLMNLALHLRYGKELFLYTPNWTYAIVLLAALGWQGLAKQRWFQLVLLLFLALLAINNGLLLRGMFEVLAPQI